MSLLRDLSLRDLQPEIMDRPDLDVGRHTDALEGLARINRLSASDRIVAAPIVDLARRHGLKELTVLDVASGAGDVAIGLARRAERQGLRLAVTGYDISPTAVERATRRAGNACVNAKFEVRDVFADSLGGPFDVVMSSLFLHHLDEAQAVEVLGKMRAAARRMVIVNDLTRSRLGYVAAHVVCRLATRSEVVHYDGPQSVAAAFRLDEIRRLADNAGLQHFEVRRVWPFRFLLTWEAP